MGTNSYAYKNVRFQYHKDNTSIKPIQTGYGPEDIVIHPSNPSLIIISCSGRRGATKAYNSIEYFDTSSNESNSTPFGMDETIANHLRPHGIFAKRSSDNKQDLLYVISHDDDEGVRQEKIYIFNINEIDKKMTLVSVWGDKKMPQLKNPNDLVVDHEGNIYVTCMKHPIRGLVYPTSYVLKISSNGNTHKLLEGNYLLNGIAIKDNHLCVTDHMKKKLLTHPLLDRSTSMITEKIPFGCGDNINLMNDGSLLLACQKSGWSFVKHHVTKRKVPLGPIYTCNGQLSNENSKKIDLKGLYYNEESLFGLASACVLADGSYYIGQIHGNKIWKVTPHS